MANNPIQILRSTTATNVPTLGTGATQNNIAYNAADGLLFWLDDSNVVQSFDLNGGGGGNILPVPQNRTAMPAAVDATLTIPSGAKNIIIWFDRISNTANANVPGVDLVIQAKDTAYVTSGYQSVGSFPAVSGSVRTDALILASAFGTGGTGGEQFVYKAEFSLLDAATNLWQYNCQGGGTLTAIMGGSQGMFTLSSQLTELRFRCIDGVNTWDNGHFSSYIEV